jgi:hypothetical protein
MKKFHLSEQTDEPPWSAASFTQCTLTKNKSYVEEIQVYTKQKEFDTYEFPAFFY